MFECNLFDIDTVYNTMIIIEFTTVISGTAFFNWNVDLLHECPFFFVQEIKI